MASSDFSVLPVIDVSALGGADEAAVRETAGRIAHACETAGFLYVSGHGVERSVIDGIFDAAHWFFALPLAERQALDVARSANFRGYVPMGIIGPNVPRRMLEAFQMMLDLPSDDPDVRAGNKMYGPNVWPANSGPFRAAMERYYDEVWALSIRLLGAFAIGLGLERDHFLADFKKPLTQLRLLHYPPQPADSAALGVEAHTDTGAFTILLQDAVGGLEVRNRAGEWILAPPIEDTFVLNIGDMMQHWTAGRFVSTPHRVANRTGRDRLSVPFFANPDYAARIRPLGQPDGPLLDAGRHVETAYLAAWPRSDRAA